MDTQASVALQKLINALAGLEVCCPNLILPNLNVLPAHFAHYSTANVDNCLPRARPGAKRQGPSRPDTQLTTEEVRRRRPGSIPGLNGSETVSGGCLRRHHIPPAASRHGNRLDCYGCPCRLPASRAQWSVAPPAIACIPSGFAARWSYTKRVRRVHARVRLVVACTREPGRRRWSRQWPYRLCEAPGRREREERGDGRAKFQWTGGGDGDAVAGLHLHNAALLARVPAGDA